MKKIISLVLSLFTILFIFSSCNKITGSVIETESYSELTTIPKYNPDDLLDADNTWQSKYALTYSYFDKKTGESQITEGKCGKYYQSVDNKSNILTFIEQNDGYMTEYMLNGNLGTGTATVITDTDINSMQSGFSLISACDPYFIVYKNVTKVGSDFIANRPATRYKQVQNDNGLSQIAYVWIDDEYGFASKCELYNADTEELQLRWELLEFTTNVTEDKVKVDVSIYELATGD